MIEVTYIVCFIVLIHLVNCLSSPGNYQHNKPSSPTDDFFNFDNDPFAKHLAETYSAKPQSPSVSKDVSKNDSSDQRDNIGARKINKPYQYFPRKSKAELGKSSTAQRSRRYQENLRLHPEKMEVRLAKKRKYERIRFEKVEPVRIYKKYGRPQAKMPELIKLEKLKALDEGQKEELHHLRMLRKKSNEKYRKKQKKE